MKILVVNGSPNGAQGNTEVLVRPFLEGVHEAGAETECVYLKDKIINHCTGCFSCWFITPGECIFADDMTELLPKIVEADMVVYAVPLYYYTVSGLMKDFMDRQLPLSQPYMDIRNGVIAHPMRHEKVDEKYIMLISNSGFPDQCHFDGLKETFRCWGRSGGRKLAGLLCCAGGSMLQTPDIKDGFTWYLDAARQAGREVVEQQGITEQTQAILDKPLTDNQQLYADVCNAYFKSIGVERIEVS